MNSVAATSNGIPSKSDAVAIPTTDEIQALGMAANIASTVNLPVATNVSNLSQSLVAQSALAQSDASTVAKPQIVDPSTKKRVVVTYVSRAGDTVAKIATHYGISAQTVRWANDLTSDALNPGTKLKILPVDGVLYTVEKGDTVDSIAKKYQADPGRVRLYNDLDLVKSVKVGSRVIVPSGVLPNTERPGYTAPLNNGDYNGLYNGYGDGYGSSNIYNASAGNRYVYGECTWYAYERRAQLGERVGSFWGNAASWAYYARLAGYRVDQSPSAGAVMQNSGGYYGHVAIVESVDPGKSVTISEMNAYRFGGGWNIVGHGTISWSDATSGYYNYIH
jgi:N-acetylmuramoyl-L-alanine amidase